MEPLEATIRKALPTIQQEEHENLMRHLTNIGVKTHSDLQFLTLEDLKDIVPLISGRRLIHFLKNRGNENHPSTPSQVNWSSSQPTHVPIQSVDWVSSYEIPWEKMPPNLRQCVLQGQRPRKHERLAMIRTIVDSIREKCLNPTRNQCAEIARTVFSKSPQSFADMTIEGELIGCGYGSLLNQIKSRVEHVNRDNTLARVRKTKRANENDTTPPCTEATALKCPKTDSYGCINWHPLDLPEGETPGTLEEKRKQMVALFTEEGPRAVERGVVEKLMKITYAAQRHVINSNPPPSIEELNEQWPFLFIKRHLCAHFETLTGIDPQKRLIDGLSTKAKKVLHFFKSQLPRWKKDVRSILKDIDSAESDVDCGVASVLTTMAYFKETEDSLFLLTDVTATPADVVGSISLPSTPRLIALGDSVLHAKRWMVTMEGRVHIYPEELPDFPSALAAFFACYYVFNVQYQEEAATTLEFIQRFYLRINPDGTKCSSKSQMSRKTGRMVQRKSTSLNPLVVALIREIVDFDWKNY